MKGICALKAVTTRKDALRKGERRGHTWSRQRRRNSQPVVELLVNQCKITCTEPPACAMKCVCSRTGPVRATCLTSRLELSNLV